jgi:Flp pilus assembly protein TadG
MKKFNKRFWRNVAGVSAIEFALVLPVMLATFFGISEVANYVLAARKAANAASAAADLVAQDTAITDDEMDDIMLSLNAVLMPFDPATAQIRITEVDADDDGDTTVGWSDARNTSPRTPGAPIDVPDGIVPDGQGVIMAEISFTYQTLFGMYLNDGMTISDKFYLKPRRSTKVLRQ